MSLMGMPERIASSEGVLLKDVGRIIFETRIDTQGTEDPTDDVFVSERIVSVAGPHPEADSDFTLFCEIISAALN